jgi:chromosome segregation ATPase
LSLWTALQPQAHYFTEFEIVAALIVSVIPQPQPPATLLQPFHETAQELATGCAQYEQALSDLFSDVDRMRAELEFHLQSVLREQCELRTRQADQSVTDQDGAADVQQLRSELENRDRQLSKALDDLQAVREELECERQRAHELSSTEETPGDYAEQLQLLQESLASANADRDLIRSECDSWRERAEQNSADQGQERVRLEQELAAARSNLVVKDGELEAGRVERHAAHAQLAETQSQLAESQEQFAETQEQLVESLDQLAEMQKQSAETLSQLAELQEQLAESQSQLADARSQFVESQSQLADTRNLVADAQDQLANSQSQLVDLQAQLANTRGQLADSQHQSDAGHSQFADAQSQLAETRQQLTAAERQVAELESQLAELRGQIEDSPRVVALAPDDPHDSTAMASMSQEREALEAELELVRSQAAELHETVRQQQHEMVTQKSELGGELQQLRRLVEKQADLIADRAVQTGRESVTQTVAAAPGNMSLPNDPVVNSVMAQFAKLQKDVAQRRRRKP